MSEAAVNVVPLRILTPEPVCADQKALIAMCREVLRHATEGSLHSIALVYTRNDSEEVTVDWQTFDGALSDIIAAIGKLQYELITSEE